MNTIHAYWLLVALNIACLVYTAVRSFKLTSFEIVLFTLIAFIPGINALALIGLGWAIIDDFVNNL